MTKTVLITGTTSGIGESFAEKFAKEGYNLVLVSRDEEKLKRQASKISNKYNNKVFIIPINLAEKGSAYTVFTKTQENSINVDVIVNNAGFNEYGLFSETDIKKEVEMIQLHTVCTTEMMKCFLPYMIENKYGRILNVGSTGSYIACPYDAVYAGTKAYILSISKAVNYELKGTGVSVTALCPGSTKTEFAKKAGMENTLLFRLFTMKPDVVVNVGYKALMKGKVSVVAGIFNKLLVLSSNVLPKSILNFSTKIMLKDNT